MKNKQDGKWTSRRGGKTTEKGEGESILDIGQTTLTYYLLLRKKKLCINIGRKFLCPEENAASV